MKLLTILTIIFTLSTPLFAQEQESWTTYRKSALYKQHAQSAAALEINIRQQQIKALKKLLPGDHAWKKDNALFFQQLEKSSEYFYSTCVPKDTSMMFLTDAEGLNQTIITYNYTCPDNYNLSLYFYFFWKGDKTQYLEIQFLEMPKIKSRVEDDFTHNE